MNPQDRNGYLPATSIATPTGGAIHFLYRRSRPLHDEEYRNDWGYEHVDRNGEVIAREVDFANETLMQRALIEYLVQWAIAPEKG